MLLARFLLAGSMALMVAWALLLGVVFRDPDLLRDDDGAAIDVSMQLTAALVEIEELRGQVSDLEAEVVRVRIAAQAPATAPTGETLVAGAPPGEDRESGTEDATSITPSATGDVAPDQLFQVDPRQTHRVVQGDSLTSIAALYGTTVEELTAANQLRDPSAIRVGSLLVIP